MTENLFSFLSGNTPGLSGTAGGPPSVDWASSWSQPPMPQRSTFENALSAARENLQKPFVRDSGGEQSRQDLDSVRTRNTPERTAQERTDTEESARQQVNRDDDTARPGRSEHKSDPEETRSGQSANDAQKQEEAESGMHSASDLKKAEQESTAFTEVDVDLDDSLLAAQDIDAEAADHSVDAQALHTSDDSIADQPDIAAQAAAEGEETHEMHEGETAAAKAPTDTAVDDQPAPGSSATGLAAAASADTGSRPLQEKPTDGSGTHPGTRTDARFTAQADASNRAAVSTGADSATALKTSTSDSVLTGAATGQSSATSTHASESFASQLAEARSLLATHATRMVDAAGAGESLAGTRSAAAPSYRGAILTPVNDPTFSGRFAAEVALLGTAGIERAEIRLHPRELGPVRIELSMSGEAARIAFSAAHPDTRQAIEQSLPLLKDLLAERGLQLGNADVSDHRHQSEEHSSADTSASEPSTSDGAVPEAGRPGEHASLRAGVRRALLSIYA